MKPKKEWFVKIQSSSETNLFGGVVFHDAMERFITHECADLHNKDDLVVMSTHGSDGEEYDEIENDCTVPYDRFKKYLDLNTSFQEFRDELKTYKEECSAEWDKINIQSFLDAQPDDDEADSSVQKKQKIATDDN